MRRSMHDLISAALRPLGGEHDAPLSTTELERELSRIRVQRQRLDDRERALLKAMSDVGGKRLAELSARLQAQGLALQDAVHATLSASARKPAIDTSKLAQPFVRKAPIKFRHPEQPALVWSGRGKTPVWVRELESAGRLDEARLFVGDSEYTGQTA